MYIYTRFVNGNKSTVKKKKKRTRKKKKRDRGEIKKSILISIISENDCLYISNLNFRSRVNQYFYIFSFFIFLVIFVFVSKPRINICERNKRNVKDK